MASRIITKKGSGVPLASDLVHGELAVDTVNKRLYTENAGGTVVEVGTSPSTIDINAGTIDNTVIGGTTPAAVTTTALVATTADINAGTIDGTVIGGSTAAAGSFTTLTAFGDVNFDSGTLFVDASENRVGVNTSSPSGRLHILDSAIFRQAKDYVGNTYEAIFTESNTGGSGTYPFNDNGNLVIQPRTSLGRDIIFATGTPTPSTRMDIADNGDISFYEDTGTTPKFFWDASAESLGIGTSSPATKLDVSGAIRASTGILFGSDTAAANTLDDYEEGTWTPVVSDGTNNATTGANNGGKYTKVGNCVTFSAQVTVGTIGSVGANARITGLPFTNVNATAGRAGVAFGFGSSLAITAGRVVTGYVELNQAFIELQYWDAVTGTTGLDGSEITDGGTLFISGHYYLV